MVSQGMPLREIYQVDAFTDRPFSGNPAAVCPLPEAEEWPDSNILQALAQENNLSETAYFKPSALSGVDFDLRWFTPTSEVQLCGHATLASAFVLFHYLGFDKPTVHFSTLSGVLSVTPIPHTKRLTLDLPTQPTQLLAFPPPEVEEALGARATEIHRADNGVYLCVFETESQIRALRPDFARLTALDHSVLVTALGNQADFVSRYFAPHKGVPEDPVTGSAHCILTPYWAERLKRPELFAIQASARGGKLHCRLNGLRVAISGDAVLIFRGKLAQRF